MPEIFEQALTVGSESIDVNGHVNNVEYVRWMQLVAGGHSAAQGGDDARDQAAGGTWVARSHFIEYLQPAFAGDVVIVKTWVSDFRKVRSKRKYKMVRQSDGAVLARAETEWVFVNIATGRPISAFAEVIASFPIVPDEREP